MTILKWKPQAKRQWGSTSMISFVKDIKGVGITSKTLGKNEEKVQPVRRIKNVGK